MSAGSTGMKDAMDPNSQFLVFPGTERIDTFFPV